MNKKGFTLIEVIVSVVLVSIVMVSLLSSLIQLRKTYSLVHENTDIVVYTSSIARVINNDLSNNNGIKMITCSSNTKCEMKMGNDTNRTIEILEHIEGEEPHENIKTSLRYLDTTKENEPKLIYIRTLELDRYIKNGVETTNGYRFLDLNSRKEEYTSDSNVGYIDVYTTLTVRVNNGIDEDISSNDILLYTAGRYDFSTLIGRTFTIALDGNGADEIDEEHTFIDEIFGIGFFGNGQVQNMSNQLRSIKKPLKRNKAFLGYYYKEGSSNEVMVIDAEGRIVSNNRFFKSDVAMPIDENDTSARVYAKWGDCKGGYYCDDTGKCVPKICTVNLDLSGGTSSYTQYNVKYKTLVPDIAANNLPYKNGNLFKGYYFSDESDKYHSDVGKGLKINEYYNNDAGVCELSLKAQWQQCAAGKFLKAPEDKTCRDCVIGSTSSAGASSCNACTGKTTTAAGSSTCNKDCSNALHVSTWKTATWNTNNTVTNLCAINTCNEGYHLSDNVCVPNIYTINLDKQSGSGGTSTVYYEYNTTRKVGGTTCYYYTNTSLTTCLANGYTISKPSRSNYTFKGYYSATSGGTNYINSSGTFVNNIYQKLPKEVNSNYTDTIKLYARWSRNAITDTLTWTSQGTVGYNGTFFPFDVTLYYSFTKGDDGNVTGTVKVTGSVSGVSGPTNYLKGDFSVGSWSKTFNEAVDTNSDWVSLSNYNFGKVNSITIEWDPDNDTTIWDPYSYQYIRINSWNESQSKKVDF